MKARLQLSNLRCMAFFDDAVYASTTRGHS